MKQNTNIGELEAVAALLLEKSQAIASDLDKTRKEREALRAERNTYETERKVQFKEISDLFERINRVSIDKTVNMKAFRDNVASIAAQAANRVKEAINTQTEYSISAQDMAAKAREQDHYQVKVVAIVCMAIMVALVAIFEVKRVVDQDTVREAKIATVRGQNMEATAKELNALWLEWLDNHPKTDEAFRAWLDKKDKENKKGK